VLNRITVARYEKPYATMRAASRIARTTSAITALATSTISAIAALDGLRGFQPARITSLAPVRKGYQMPSKICLGFTD
jgi:hypothetical protein